MQRVPPVGGTRLVASDLRLSPVNEIDLKHTHNEFALAKKGAKVEGRAPLAPTSPGWDTACCVPTLSGHVNCISAFEVDLVQYAVLEMQLVDGDENAPRMVPFFDIRHDRDRG